MGIECNNTVELNAIPGSIALVSKPIEAEEWKNEVASISYSMLGSNMHKSS